MLEITDEEAAELIHEALPNIDWAMQITEDGHRFTLQIFTEPRHQYNYDCLDNSFYDGVFFKQVLRDIAPPIIASRLYVAPSTDTLQ